MSNIVSLLNAIPILSDKYTKSSNSFGESIRGSSFIFTSWANLLIVNPLKFWFGLKSKSLLVVLFNRALILAIKILGENGLVT